MERPPFSAAGSAAGTLYQIRYALLLLAQAALLDDPTTSMQVEGLDDIALTNESGSWAAQSKHHQAETKLSDHSVDLWKTLRIWAYTAMHDPSSLENTIFTLVTTSQCAPESAVNIIARAGAPNLDTAKSVTSTLEAIARTSGNQANKPGYDQFLALRPADRLRLISRIRILDSSPSDVDIQKVLTNLLRNSVTGRPQLLALVRQLEGWWFARIALHLRDASDRITGAEVLNKIREIADSLGPESLPLNYEIFAKAPEDVPEDAVYVKQLRLIECGDNVILRAVTDFVRSARQISEWMREELMFVNELANYDRRLADEWATRFELLRDQVATELDNKVLAEKGRDFYGSIMALPLPIRRDWTDAFIMRGEYHKLANAKTLGWHPRFEESLR